MWPDLSHLEVIRHKLASSGSVEIPSVGYSMYPTIRSGDLCTFVPIQQKRLKPGEILLFADLEGRLIGHRLLRMELSGEETRVICKGDTNLYPDDPVTIEQVIGVLVTIIRKKPSGKIKTIPAGSLKAVLWGIAVRRLRGLSYLLRKIAAMDAASHVQLAQKQ